MIGAALQRHLERGEESLRLTLGNEYAEAIESLREQPRSVEALPSLRWMRERVHRSRVVRRSLVGASMALLLVALAIALIQFL